MMEISFSDEGNQLEGFVIELRQTIKNKLVALFAHYILRFVKNRMKKEIFALWFVTIYLVVYAIIAFLEFSTTLVFFLFFLSPFLLVWMVLLVLKSKIHPPKTLKDGEEWGYQDVNKNDLGIF